MKNTVFTHKFWRPFLDCMPQLFFRPQYVWFPVHLKGHLIPLCYETLVVNWQNWLFTLFHQSRSVLSPNPIHRRFYCLFNRLFRHRSKKTSKLRVTALCVGNSPETGEFPAQRASNAENVSIWWRHHELLCSIWQYGRVPPEKSGQYHDHLLWSEWTQRQATDDTRWHTDLREGGIPGSEETHPATYLAQRLQG